MASKKFHDESCLTNQIARELARVGYMLQWPNYCRECNGYGAHFFQYDPSPAGIGLSAGYMTDADPCGCVESGHCPRCGEAGVDPECGDYCTECKWTFETLGIADPAECECWDWGQTYFMAIRSDQY